ncbi:hypothetical protein [Streptomyces lushanensis]|uniref:hypothetical protein n=1 Tax=Streptomyces lushanensis TaxID=1434255 RepID=UPI00082C286B|nr:hypothetical protein [Streptomyces lushanensis]
MSEVLNGLLPDAAAGVMPRPEYDPATRNPAEREAAKAAELSAETGRFVSPHTIRRRRRRHQKRGVMGMADGRQAPRRPVLGQVDPQVVEVLRRLMDQAVDGSTLTISYYFELVGQAMKKLEGPPVEMPSRATFYRARVSGSEMELEHGPLAHGWADQRWALARAPRGCPSHG